MEVCISIVGSVVGSIAAKAAEYTVDPIKHHISYTFNFGSKLQNLKDHLDKLKDAKERVQHSVDAAKRNGEEIEEDVQKWLINAEKTITGEAKRVIENERKAANRCFVGLCPNFKARHQLGKRAEEETKIIVELLEESRFDRVSYCAAQTGLGTAPIKGYESFESRAPTLEKIMEALKDPTIQTIGVHGMAGVGKTMLVKEVARKSREEHLFDDVVIATVSHNPNIRNIQGEIADMLGLEFLEDTESGRAMRLRRRLKNGRKVLIVLDDVWARLDLETVGIQLEDKSKAEDPISYKTNSNSLQKTTYDNRCKILLTSRSQDVLRMMDAERTFEVGILSQEESMDLFAKIVGDLVEKPDYRPIALEVVEKCARLPVAISAIASALKHTSLFMWEDALRHLKRVSPTNIEGMQENVYSALELSYRLLRSEEAQSLFLLCGLFPQSFNVSVFDLLKYSLGLDMLEDVNTLEEARNRVTALIHKLIASGLLLSSDDKDHVKMHDIVRDVSISIASKDKKMFIVEEEIRLTKLLKMGKLNDCTAISLSYGDIHELPDMLECPKLKLLMLLTEGDFSLIVSDNIFNQMKELKVLELSGIRFSSLPSSFLSLTNLQTLSLFRCMLSDLTIIGKLKTLEVLTFYNCDIEQLPREMAELTQLRLLDLSECSKLHVIPPNVISSLSQLEELHLVNSFYQWDIEGNASLTELKCLSHLSAIDVKICEAQVIPRGLFSERLERYTVFIGKKWTWSDDKHDNLRTLKLKLSSNHLDHGIQTLLKRTENLHLDEMKGFKNVLYELDTDGFPLLEHLHVQNSHEIEYIINSKEWVPCKAFPLLESLFLHNLIKLEKICYGNLVAESFAKLRMINVESCHRLKSLFSFSVANMLLQLQEISVTKCNNITEIFVGEEETDNHAGTTNKVEFGHLRSLTLQCLPKLICFGSIEKRPSGFQQGGPQSTNAATLFSREVMFPYLANLRLSSISTERIWHNHHSLASYCIQNLTTLIIEDCGELHHLLSTSMVRLLKQLKHLEISGCASMIEVILTEVKEDEMKDEIVFPQLNSLEIKNLPNLVGFCSGNHSVEFLSLKLLLIEQCPKLKEFIFKSTAKSTDVENKGHEEINLDTTSNLEPLFGERVAFPSLEKLTISHLESVKTIFHNQLPAYSFSQLKVMEVQCCEGLLTIFSAIVLGRFRSLETLRVSDCNSLEEVFDIQELNVGETHGEKSTQLRNLTIHHLPNLKNLWNQDPEGILSFQNLQLVDVCDCQGLKYLFPASVAKGLLQLETLRVESCGVEEIIAKKEEREGAIRLLFLHASSLTLWNLPKLKYFCSDIHTTVWPLLKTLNIYHCGEVVATKLFSIGGTNKVVPQLEELSLDSSEIDMIIHHSWFQMDLFGNIKVLHVSCYHDESVFPFSLIQRFYNLEKLVVHCCVSEELFPYKADHVGEEEPVKALTNIRKLRLHFLKNLQHIWGQDLRFNKFFLNLEILQVWQCDGLTRLAPSSASFRNLRTLEVWRCHFMINLLTSSTAKSLCQITKMSVAECGMVREIVENDGNETKDEIIFYKLKCLEFYLLPSLTSFSPGNIYFKFPFLEEVILEECPNLMTFCRGALSTPMLARDLNISVQQLHKEKVEYLKLSDFPILMEIWNTNPQGMLEFRNLKSLEVCECSSMRFLLTSFMASSLVQLQSMEVSRCAMMEKIIEDEGIDDAVRNKIVFPSLESILFRACSNLTSFYVGSKSVECPSLKRVTIINCKKILAFASVSCMEQMIESIDGGNGERLGAEVLDNPVAPFFTNKVMFPNLERLELRSMNIEELWLNELSARSIGVQKLTTLVVDRLRNMKCLFFSSSVRRFIALKNLHISSCDLLEELIGAKVFVGEEKMGLMLFPTLEYFELCDLPKLTRICCADSVEFSSLRELKIVRCPMLKSFNSSPVRRGTEAENEGKNNNSMKNFLIDIPPLLDDKVVFPKLEKLELESSSVEKLWHGQLSTMTIGVQNLTRLTVRNCCNLEYLFVSSMVKSFAHHDLHDCGTKEEVIVRGGLRKEEKMSKLVLPQLKFLGLEGLPKLTKICRGSSIEFSSLRKMIITRCGLNTIKSTLACDNENTIIEYEGRSNEATRNLPVDMPPLWDENVAFPNLEELRITSILTEKLWLQLPTVSSGFNNLTGLNVWACHNLKYLFSFFMVKCLVQLKELEIVFCDKMEEIIKTEGLLEAEKRIIFPKLDYLKLFILPNLTRFCDGDSIEFPSLTGMRIDRCHLLTTFISNSAIVGTSNEARRNSSKENIPEDLPSLFDEKVALPKLQNLQIFNMKNLMRLWNGQLAMDSFCKLEYLTVGKCIKLLNIFPFSLLERLQKLKTLFISRCENLEVIFDLRQLEATQSTMVKEIIKFELGEVEHLELDNLPRLKSFYHMIHSSVWPSLKEMKIHECYKVEIFASENLSFQEKQPEIPIQQPLFWVDKASFPNLEKLNLQGNNKMEIWRGKLPMMYLCKLKVVELIGFTIQSVISPSYFFQSLPSLEKLVIRDASFNEIFQGEGLGDEENHAWALTELNEFQLSELPELMHIWKERFQHGKPFQNLISLEVLKCSKLKSLASSSTSFQNLMTLKVWQCHGLKYLFSYSTARSLVQLSSMCITDCRMLEEIIAYVGTDGMEDGNVFTQLKCLELGDLPCLKSFFEGNYTLKFPSLEEVILDGCRMMESFCQGELSTPRLQRIQLGKYEDKWRWEGCLNTTIQRLFSQKDCRDLWK